MVRLLYTYLYRYTEFANWRTESSKTRIITDEEFDTMKKNHSIIGMVYSEKHKEFFMIFTDNLHAVSIKVFEEGITDVAIDE